LRVCFFLLYTTYRHSPNLVAAFPGLNEPGPSRTIAMLDSNDTSSMNRLLALKEPVSARICSDPDWSYQPLDESREAIPIKLSRALVAHHHRQIHHPPCPNLQHSRLREIPLGILSIDHHAIDPHLDKVLVKPYKLAVLIRVRQL